MQQTLSLHIDHDREGTYFTLPFTMPEGVEVFKLSYRYDRYLEESQPAANGAFFTRREANIVDLGLIGPGGEEVGDTGSDKTEIEISETRATPGYHPCALRPGEWQILVGPYKVVPEGVTVTYELSFTLKSRRLLKGDLHTHTVASDGVYTAKELGKKALGSHLDFLAITDHNQPVSPEALPSVPGVTFIPGVEWTHFRGHANFLGSSRPYDGSFAANTMEEIAARFNSARERGALVVINHPFDEGCPFHFDLERLPFDCVEIWNGPMRESNLRALAFWHGLLVSGRQVPAVAGSDYHRDSPFMLLGGPTTCVYSMSAAPSDILAAIRQGHAYMIFTPQGPTLELTAGEAIMGDRVSWPDVREVRLEVSGLRKGDSLRVVTASASETVLEAQEDGRYSGVYEMRAPGFARVEIWRAFLPGLPLLPALISNPIYFSA